MPADSHSAAPGRRVSVLCLADLTLRPDGTLVLRPMPPNAADLDTWISVNKAAEILGVSSRTVLRWLGEFLVYRRPMPGKYDVSLHSVRDLRQAVNNSEFWMDFRIQRPIRNAVRAGMDKLYESSLQAYCPGDAKPLHKG